MNKDSVLDLKARMLTRAYQAPGERRHERGYRARSAAAPMRQFSVSEATPLAAVGIAPGRGKKAKQKDGFRLAVRVFRGHNAMVPMLFEGLGISPNSKEVDIAVGVNYKPRLTMSAGGSIGHFKITAGTLGGFVEDKAGYYMLSNNHVLANGNQCFQGDPILQPGPLDAQGNFDVVGALHKWFPLSKVDHNGVDAAVASFSDAVEFFEPWNYPGVGTIRKQPSADRFAVSRVAKVGRTTGLTRGIVTAFELDGVAIDYGTPSDPAVVVYDDQIEVIGAPASNPFSQPGDSGSFIIDRDRLEVYALLYGGGPDSQGIDRTLAQFMPDVFSKIGVQLVQ